MRVESRLWSVRFGRVRRAPSILIVVVKFVQVCLSGEHKKTEKKKLSLMELIVHASLLQDRRRWPFQHFKALLPVGVDEADEGAALVPLKARSRDADVIPQLNLA